MKLWIKRKRSVDKEKKDFRGVRHKESPIIIGVNDKKVTNVIPVEVHLIPNGTLTDQPALAFLSVDRDQYCYIGQISVKMLNEGLQEIGYKLIKDEVNN